MAALAEAYLTPHGGYGIGKLLYIGLILSEQKEHQAQGGLAPYAGQSGKLLYCFFKQA